MGSNPYANYIVRYDTNTYSWNALYQGLNSYVYAIAIEGSNVFVGGIFTNAGDNTNADYIARWDGN